MNPIQTTPWTDTAKMIALFLVSAFIIVIIIWMFRPPQIDAGSTAVLNTMIGALGGMVSMIVSFYFGSSRSAAAKDNTIAALVTPPPPPPPLTEGVAPQPAPPPSPLPRTTPSG